jgi:hypothetical protein
MIMVYKATYVCDQPAADDGADNGAGELTMALTMSPTVASVLVSVKLVVLSVSMPVVLLVLVWKYLVKMTWQLATMAWARVLPVGREGQKAPSSRGARHLATTVLMLARLTS